MLCLLCLISCVALATGVPRERKLLDFDWRFQLGHGTDIAKDFGYGTGIQFAKAGEAVGAARAGFDDSSWRKVNIPHDWVVELDFVPEGDGLHTAHGSKPVGRSFPDTTIGWYRKSFEIPATDKGRRLSVEFDGVFRDSMVWLNGHLLGREMSGYSSFSYDMTDFINYGGQNVLSVRVDASNYEGWFYEGAGIYRHVWLTKTAPVHIPQWGVFASATVSGKTSTVTIQTEVTNDADSAQTVDLSSALLDPHGKQVAEITTGGVKLEPWSKKVFTQKIKVADPQLWSIESPHLYKVASTISAGKEQVDSFETHFGIRTLKWDANKGFFLNGKRVEIKGMCNHQDHAGVGSALPDRIQYFRIEKLKEMGCNAYRTSHNAPTPELLDACDKLGMLVMDENRLLDSSEDVLAQFTRQIKRDRNHPSVILWSIGNEEYEQGNPRGQMIATTLKRLCNTLDPTRLTTYAGNNGDQFEGVNSVVDVRGFNYGQDATDPYHKAHPTQFLMGSETASTLATRGEYAKDNEKGFMPAYDIGKPDWGNTAEEWWTHFAERPYLAGGFVWTGFDYRGEPTPYGWPCISSHFGILDTCGFPKDDFFYYKAWWGNEDVLHILPHWNWPGKEGQPIAVWCQSNLDEVELFLNGKSQGRKTMKRNSHLEWEVVYEPGTLEARGYRAGKLVKTERVESTGPGAQIVLTPDRTVIDANGEDVSMVTVSAVDEQGRLVPFADNDINFEVEGGNIIGVGNGNPSSHEADRFVQEGRAAKVEGWKMQTIANENDPLILSSDWPGAKDVDISHGAGQLAPGTYAAFRSTIEAAPDMLGHEIKMAVGQIDDFGWVYLNGKLIGTTDEWDRTYSYDVSTLLHAGPNQLVVVVKNNGGRGGLGRGVSLGYLLPQPQYHRKLFHGLAQVIVQSTTKAGKISLRASAPGLKSTAVELDAKAAAFRGY